MSRSRALAIGLVALFVPVVVLAHARLKSSTPAAGERLFLPPKTIELEFSETPELALTTIALTAADGSRIPVGALARSARSARGVVGPISGTLRDGIYKVSWTTAAEDGHPTRGSYIFEVRQSADMSRMMAGMRNGDHSMDEDQSGSFGVESPAYIIIRWLQFLALLIVIGAVAFRQLVLSFLKRKEDPDSAMIPDAARHAAHWGFWAVVSLFLVAILRLVAQSYLVHGGIAGVAPAMLGSMITQTMWGRGWLLQLVGAATAGTGFHFARKHDVSRWWGIATLGAVLLAFSPALSGHASSTPRLTTLAILADALHVTGAGGWLGSLLMVVAVGIPAALRLPKESRGPMAAEVVNAFSPTALVFAGIVSATGVFSAWLHLGSVPALWTTAYGKTLLVKLAILSVVAVTGAYNWLRVKPHLGRVEGATKITRSARVELAVGVLVILATAVLVALSTPHEASLKVSLAQKVFVHNG